MSRIHDGALRRVVRVDDALALIEVTSHGTLDDPRLEARVLATRGEVNEGALHTKIWRVLNVRADLAPFYEYARRDPVLWQTVERLYGLHSLQADTVFEALVLTMIEQQIALKQALIAERWLLTWGGEMIAYEGENYYAFPRPQQIAAAAVSDLLPLKITFGRMQRMIDLASTITAGTLDLEGLRDQPAEAVYKTLIALKGVGQWTAAWTITRALGRYRYVGAGDVALRAAVNTYYYGQSGRADALLVDQTFARYGEFDGIAAYYTLMRWAFERYALW